MQEKPPPKKRGRKSKKTLEAEAKLKNNTNSEPVKVPKKRGRKPKGGKVIQQPINFGSVSKTKPNVILHLRCTSDDLKKTSFISETEYNPDIETIESFSLNTNQKSGNLPFEILESKVETQNILQINKEPEKTNTVNDKEKCNIKDIWGKLKKLENNLHNNVVDKKADCFHCTCGFDNPPIFIPKFQIDNTYHVYGCFCSPECAVAYLMNEAIDSSVKFERYHLINHVYGKIYKYEKNIKPAPSPYYLLSRYYGNLSIEEYRKLLQNERLLLIVDKPLTRVLPELHEDNNEYIINNSNSSNSFDITNNTIQSYHLKQNVKPNNKSSILSSNFGF